MPGPGPHAAPPAPAIDLDAPIQRLPGVGPQRGERLARLGIFTARDLLFSLPRRVTDRTTITPIAQLQCGKPSTVVARVVKATVRRRRGGGRADLVAQVSDASGPLEVVWWGQPYLLHSVVPGATVALFGEVARFRGLTMSSPEFEVLDADLAESLSFGRIVPTYGLTEGLSQRWMRALVQRILAAIPDSIEETLPAAALAPLELPGLASAVIAAHAPASLADHALARRRLALEELVELMLALGLSRERRRAELPSLRQRPGARFGRALDSLPFTLTFAQRRALDEILADMAAGTAMHRLLEGEVGSGKTVVALLAAVAAIDSGYQAAIMVPTEILAEQHSRSALRLLPGVRVVLLTGAASGRMRSDSLAALARGDGELAIGTHALFASHVHFRRLGLVVVDEQHRFGVRERAALTGKGHSPDILVMTATPIPRSLALTVFGDLDLSVIDERPPGRRPARTHVVTVDRRALVDRFLADRLARGEQIMVITPRIEADPERELAAATERWEELRRHPLLGQFPVGLLHGRLGSDEKASVMAGFRRGSLKLLVATTVVEVGVDVAAVTVIVVEHPERYGLSQLHQLRGRAGRGERRAHCILMVDPELPAETRARLDQFARTDDGFAVAELDLAGRGPGELLGADQHGFGGFRVAHPLRDQDLVLAARRIADRLLAADPELGAVSPALRAAVGRRLKARPPALPPAAFAG